MKAIIVQARTDEFSERTPTHLRLDFLSNLISHWCVYYIHLLFLLFVQLTSRNSEKVEALLKVAFEQCHNFHFS